MKGIKTIISYTSYDPKPDDFPESWFKASRIEFDPYGNKTQETLFDKNGREVEKHIFQFADEKHIKNELHYLDGKLNEVVEYNRDALGQLTEARHKFHDGGISTLQFHRKEQTETIVTKNEKGETEQRIETIYSEAGKAMQSQKYNGLSELLEKQIFAYHQNGSLGEHKIFNGQHILISRFEYDADEFPIEENHYSDLGILTSRIQYSYEQNGRLCSIQGPHDLTRFTYDDKNRTVKEENFGHTGSPERTCIKRFDANDLLVESFEYASGQQYEMEPQVVARTLATYTSKKVHYEFYK